MRMTASWSGSHDPAVYKSVTRRSVPMASSPSDPQQTDRHRSRHPGMRKARLAVHHRCACSGLKALRNTSAARRHTAKLCYRFGPLTPSARSANLIAGDGTKNGLCAPNKEPVTNQKPLLDRKSPIQVRIHLPPAESQQTSGSGSDDAQAPRWALSSASLANPISRMTNGSSRKPLATTQVVNSGFL